MATYKEMLGIIKRAGVVWVPLSLEEILRVSGSFVGESRDSVFSAKSLDAHGKISDDLLFMGLWVKNGIPQVTFLPTEVKVGINSSTVLNKATGQVENTYRVLEETLFKQNSFEAKFYLDFFMKLYFANAAKLYSNMEMSKATYDDIQGKRVLISQGQLNINNSLTDAYHNKFVFSLKAGVWNRSIKNTDTHCLVEVPEADAFKYSGIETNEIINNVQDGNLDFDEKMFLENINQVHSVEPFNYLNDETESVETKSSEDDEPMEDNELVATAPVPDYPDSEPTDMDDPSDYSQDQGQSKQDEPETEDENQRNEPQVTDEVQSNESLSGSKTQTASQATNGDRIRIGTIKGSKRKVYWEFGNPQLANRHMLITGKSGQGKTYFMQTLLLELSRSRIDSLVIDYTDSYLPGQLNPILEENVDKLTQHIVLQDKLPINPFKKQTLIIGDISVTEKDNNVVARVAEVLDFVFDLGIQQKSRLKTIMNEGMQRYSSYTFTHLKEDLMDSKDDKTLFGRLQSLLENDPFSYNNSEFDWSEYFSNQGQINIIQLSGFQTSIQKAIQEFLMWDLFNYSKLNTSKKLIYPVFLDEVQNLNFNSDAPTVKILREGRKFGWSGIFATQSLSSIKGEVDAIYNTAEQIHFLPLENQTKAIAKSISSDKNEQNRLELDLSNLRKGQCIVNGPMLNDRDELVKASQIVNVDSLQNRL